MNAALKQAPDINDPMQDENNPKPINLTECNKAFPALDSMLTVKVSEGKGRGIFATKVSLPI